MAVPFAQIVATTYDRVVNERDKAQNQFEESAFLRYLEKAGGVKKVKGGTNLEFTVDYRKNPGTDVLATDMTPTSTSKTEVMTAVSFPWATVIVPINWSITDEAKNSGSDTQKVDLVSSLVDNAFASHDDEIEADLFASSPTDGFLSLPTIITDDGEGTVGQVNAAVETWWQNQFETSNNSNNLIAAMTAVWNGCAKGSGSKLTPNVLASGSDTHAIYESLLQPQQRFVDGDTASGGFKALAFKTSKYIFSQHGTDDIYFLNTKNFKLYAISGYFRQRRSAIEHLNAAAMNMKVASVCQVATNNRSRLGVVKYTG